jgi:tetratricopeptide (TPR) repeat protein
LNSPAAPREGTGAKPGLLRGLIFRAVLLAIVVVVPLGIAEAALRLAGYGYETPFLLRRDVNGKTVFVDNPKFAFRFYPPRLARSGQPLRVEAAKADGTIRIVVMGESAAMGDPDPAYGMPRQLESMLGARFPGRRFEVVNAAVTAINSHAFPDIADACAALSPDFWVIYGGHNELMGPFGPGGLSGGGAPGWARTLGLALQRWRVGQALTTAARAIRSAGATNSEWAGMEMFQGVKIDPAGAAVARAAEDFEKNLVATLRRAKAAGGVVLAVTPVSNLRDSGPFGSLTAEPKDALAAAAPDIASGNWSNAAVKLKVLEAGPDGRHPVTQFYLGRVRLMAGDAGGVGNLIAARDADAMPFRASKPFIEAMRRAAGEAGAELVDAEKAFLSGPERAPGAESFWEHVHFNLHGNHTLATLIGDAVAARLPAAAARGALPSWPTEAEVAKLLGWTPWHLSREIETVRARVDRPPFTGQVNSEERKALLAQQLGELKPELLAPAFERHAAICREALARRTNDWMLHDQFAQLLEAFGDREGAVEHWRTAAELEPDALLVHYRLGQALSKEAKTANEAATQLRAALALREDFPEGWEALGEALGQTQDFAGADAAFQRAVALRPSFTVAAVNRGLTLAAAGKTNLAVEAIQAAAAADPKNPLPWQRLAKVLADGGRFNEAAEAWEKAVPLRPDSFGVRYEAGLAWQRAGQPTKAAPYWLEALKLNPNHAESHYFVGVEMAREKRFEDAEKAFREAIRLKPAFASAHLNLGVALISMKRADEALPEFEKAAELDPNDPRARDYAKAARQYLAQPH